MTREVESGGKLSRSTTIVSDPQSASVDEGNGGSVGDDGNERVQFESLWNRDTQDADHVATSAALFDEREVQGLQNKPGLDADTGLYLTSEEMSDLHSDHC